MALNPALFEAWHFAVLMVAGLSVGSLGLLLLGHLLGGDWVTPMDDELQPAALLTPLAGLMALPLALQEWPGATTLAGRLPTLAAWLDGGLVTVRLVACYVVWTAVAWLLVPMRESRAAAVAGLLILLPTVSVAGIDWVLNRDPFWWTTLFGFAFAVSQLAPALALALLVNVAEGEPTSRIHDRSLTTALLTLVLLTLWLWFTQFLAAYLGNLPEEAAWYEARLTGSRGILLAGAAGMMLAAAALLIGGGRKRATTLAASVLILLQHPLHMGWLLRPEGRPALGLVDIIALVLLGGVWLGAFSLISRRQRASVRQSGLPGSS